MNKFTGNPYLPLYEYIPDSEPRLFEGRLYVYGSHDTGGGDFFCLEDYALWSAQENDLTDWKYEGIIYRKDQDPSNKNGELQLFAPDVVKGPDGKYYLFYCLKMLREFGVAVSDTPNGPFEFYGHVKNEDGSIFDKYMPYDPSVLVDDDGRVYLYYGFSSEMLSEKFGTEISPGAVVVELKRDILTVCSEPKVLVPWEGLAEGTEFYGHAYFEAPSMRKIGELYYLVYSSQWCRELCYAVSDRPNEGFKYGGVIIDNSDLGFNGNKSPKYIPGNNHGGIIEVKGKYYIFYHRHTNANSFSRQGCAEEIKILSDGSIPQVEITTKGILGKNLQAEGNFSAALACNLYGKNPELFLDFRGVDKEKIPYITQRIEDSKEIQLITNFADGSVAAYKYFDFNEIKGIEIELRGKAKGDFELTIGESVFTLAIEVNSDAWEYIKIPFECTGADSLLFRFKGEGSLELLSFSFIK